MTTTLYWFTNDLRLDDNRALLDAAGGNRLLCVYVVDPSWFAPGRYQLPAMGAHRWRFLCESLADLNAQLQQLGQELFIVFDHAVTALPKLAEAVGATALVCSAQHGYNERQQINHLRANCPFFVKTIETFTLFERSQGPWLAEQLSGYFTGFRKVAEQHQPLPAVQPPSSLPTKPNSLPALLSVDQLERIHPITPIAEQHQAHTLAVGGASAATSHCQQYFNSHCPANYKRTRNALDGWQNSSKLSLWLSHGCLSARRAKAWINRYENDHGKNESTYWLYFELLWREYFQWLAITLEKDLFHFGGRRKKTPLTTFYPERFRKWCQGDTPYPLVNACMRELNATGYLSNRGRQIVASCLVNELACDWRYGAAWFEHQLIDYDCAANWGNWQYIAGVGADPRGGRHFDIDKQQTQFDPEGHYRQLWLGDNPSTPRSLDGQDMVGWPI